MKETIITTAKRILADRPVALGIGAFLIGCIIYCIYVASSLQPSDLQVAVHYTAFGMTNFYREKWYYLLSFVLFGVIMAVVHTLVIVKVYTQDRRQLAVFLLGLSFLTLFIAWMITGAVLRIAAF